MTFRPTATYKRWRGRETEAASAAQRCVIPLPARWPGRGMAAYTVDVDVEMTVSAGPVSRGGGVSIQWMPVCSGCVRAVLCAGTSTCDRSLMRFDCIWLHE